MIRRHAFVAVFIVLLFGSCFSSCECARSDFTCLRNNINFTIIYDGVDVFDRDGLFSSDSVQIAQDFLDNTPSSLSINNRSYSLENIFENSSYIITISNVSYSLDIVTTEDNFMCCSCLLYTSPSPRDQRGSRMPSSA